MIRSRILPPVAALALGWVATAPIPARAALDLEGGVPGDWTASPPGTLAITGHHYRLGTESLRWSWQNDSTLTTANPSIDPGKVLEFFHNTCDLWIYNETPAGTLTVEFLDPSDEVQFRFGIQLNFTGWRRIVRSFRYDMESPGGGTDLSSVRFIAPASGSGSLCLDALEWAGPRLTRHRDDAMPDVGDYFSSTLHHDLSQLDGPSSPPAANPEELAALPVIGTRFWPGLEGSAPSASALASAKSAFTSWNIVRDANGIRGDPVDRDNTGQIDAFLGILARGWHHLADSEARDMALLTVEHLLDQGFAGGSAEAAAADTNGYATREIVRTLVLLRDQYDPATRAAVKDLLRWRLKPGFAWDPDLSANKNTDWIHTESQGLMGLALGFSDSDQATVEELRALGHYFDRYLEITSSAAGAIKPDGTSFHHSAHYNHYMYSHGTMAGRLHELRDTPFMVSQESYERLRDAVRVIALTGNDLEYANGFSGRFPLTGSFPLSSTNLSRLAIAGGGFYGEPADPEVARLHNRLWNDDPLLQPYGVEPFPTGFWQFNYSPAGLYRTGSAVVSIKGFNDTFWGTEIYSSSNRYGRYQSYGAVEVLYPGGRLASGLDIDGWDWNHPPGATTITLPFNDLKATEDRQDEVAATRFCGALAGDLDPAGEFGVKGSFGIFGMKFGQAPISPTHNPSFTFRKSVFAADGMLLCLGSDIANDDASHTTATTLFQVALPSGSTPTHHSSGDFTGFPQTPTLGSGPQWFVDHLGTGYHVDAGQSVRLERRSQSSPSQSGSEGDTTGDFAKAWIDHGTAPSGASHRFIVVPGTSPAAMQQLTADLAGPAPPFTVLRQDPVAHVADLHGGETRAYVCFEPLASPSHPPLVETSAPALVATRGTTTRLTVSCANPELDLDFRERSPAGAVIIDARLAGQWAIEHPHPDCELLSADASGTLLRFITTDANPVEVGLVADNGAPTGILSVSEDFSSGPGSLVGWVGTGPTGLAHTTSNRDSDAANHDPATSDGGGDDAAGDGALLFDPLDDSPGNEQIAFTFNGRMNLREHYTLDIATFNPTNNYNRYRIALWNKSDDVLLVETGDIVQGAGAVGCRESTLSYTPRLSDDGDLLELRIVEDHDLAARKVAVDFFSLTVMDAGHDTGLLTLADLRLPAGAYAGSTTFFDPGFGPLATRSPATAPPFDLPCNLRGTSQNPGGPAPDSANDIGLQTYSETTAIVQLNRFGSSTDGGSTGNGRVGMVQWKIDLGEVADYLSASGRQLDTLDLRLLTNPAGGSSPAADEVPYDVYLSYSSAGEGIGLTDLSANDAGFNYDTFWWPATGAGEGSVVNGTHRILKLGHVGDLDLTTDLAPMFAAGVREMNLLVASGGFLSGRRIEILEGSGVTFRASDPLPADPFESFMSAYPGLSGDDALPDSDPDGDGVSNLGEFIHGGTAPDDHQQAHAPRGRRVGVDYVFSLLAKTGAAFGGNPSPTAIVDGITIRVEGSRDLQSYDQEVEETGVDPGLPEAPAGYRWYSFRFPPTVPPAPRGFLRLVLDKS